MKWREYKLDDKTIRFTLKSKWTNMDRSGYFPSPHDSISIDGVDWNDDHDLYWSFCIDTYEYRVYNDGNPKAIDDILDLETKVIATYLHGIFCNYNHTDGCSWFYGDWENRTYSHGLYYEKAVILSARADAVGVSQEDLIDLLKLMVGLY